MLSKESIEDDILDLTAEVNNMPLPDKAENDAKSFAHILETAQLEALQVALDDKRQNTSLRREVSTKVFKLIAAWYVFIFAAFFITLWIKKEEMGESVIIALLTTTTINVLGLMLVVVKNLFPNQDSKK